MVNLSSLAGQSCGSQTLPGDLSTLLSSSLLFISTAWKWSCLGSPGALLRFGLPGIRVQSPTRRDSNRPSKVIDTHSVSDCTIGFWRRWQSALRKPLQSPSNDVQAFLPVWAADRLHLQIKVSFWSQAWHIRSIARSLVALTGCATTNTGSNSGALSRTIPSDQFDNMVILFGGERMPDCLFLWL
jgi:hypothetical protein